MPARKAQDGQWRGHHLRHDIAGVRELQRGPQDLPCTISRGESFRMITTRHQLILQSLIARGDQKAPQPGPSMVNTTDAYATNPALLSSGIEGTEAAGEYPYTVGHNAGAEYQ